MEINYLPEDVILKLKGIVADFDNKEKKHKNYVHAVEHMEEMEVHLYGEKPETLLKRVRPREDPAIREYRLEAYEPTTTSTAEKALSIVNKIFNPKLYSIRFEEGSEQDILKQYSMVEYPGFNSVVNYLSSVGLKKTMADPNGVFLIQPNDYPKTLTERVYPIISYYCSEDIHYISKDLGVFFVDKKVGDKGEKYFYYQIVDTQGIYNIVITSVDSKNWEITEISKYMHLIGKVPFWHLGGTYDHEHYGLYKSFFYPAVPFWNKAICAESDLDGAFISHLHPQKWEVADECDYVENGQTCTNGLIFNEKGGDPHKCPSCGGAGRKAVKSPFQTYWVNKDKFDGVNNGVPAPPAGYISVPTEATQMLSDRVDKLLEKGLNALAMDIVNRIGENQSGVSKAYDRTELFDFLGKIRDLFYDRHLPDIFYFFAKYMFINKSEEEIAKIEPNINKPVDFDIFTTSELSDQLKVAKGSGINSSYLSVKQIEIQNKEFQGEPDLLTQLNLIVELDPFAEMSRDDISMMIMNGTISKADGIVHDNIRDFVRRAMIENKGFVGLDYIKQMEVLRGFAKEIEEANKVKLDTNVIQNDSEPANGQGFGDS